MAGPDISTLTGWEQATEKMLQDGPWAAFCLLLLIFIAFLVRALLKANTSSTNALVANASAMTALKTHIENVFKPQDNGQ